MSTDYLRHGRCGACGRPAHEAPSGRWWHEGRPCRARSQSMWSIDDMPVRNACRFIPENEPLPGQSGWHLHALDRDPESGVPSGYGACTCDPLAAVRARLAAEAETGEES